MKAKHWYDYLWVLKSSQRKIIFHTLSQMAIVVCT